MPPFEPTLEITLRSTDGLDDVKERTFLLSPHLAVPVGRASRSNRQNTRPTSANAYIDSPVVSRDHAVFTTNTSLGIPTVYIRDAGSMHGTFVNGTKAATDRDLMLRNGDVLKFGTDVIRDNDSFIAKEYHFGFRPAPKVDPAPPMTFAVPDVLSDDEDNYSDSFGSNSSPPPPPPPRPARYGSQSNPVICDLDDSEDTHQSPAVVMVDDFTIQPRAQPSLPSAANPAESKPSSGGTHFFFPDEIDDEPINYDSDHASDDASSLFVPDLTTSDPFLQPTANPMNKAGSPDLLDRVEPEDEEMDMSSDNQSEEGSEEESEGSASDSEALDDDDDDAADSSREPSIDVEAAVDRLKALEKAQTGLGSSPSPLVNVPQSSATSASSNQPQPASNRSSYVSMSLKNIMDGFESTGESVAAAPPPKIASSNPTVASFSSLLAKEVEPVKSKSTDEPMAFKNYPWHPYPVPPRPAAPKSMEWGAPLVSAIAPTGMRDSNDWFGDAPAMSPFGMGGLPESEFSGFTFGRTPLSASVDSHSPAKPYTTGPFKATEPAHPALNHDMGVSPPPDAFEYDASSITPPESKQEVAKPRTKVSIPEIVEDTPEQPPTPTSVSSLKRKADVLDEDESEEIDIVPVVAPIPQNSSTEAVAVPEPPTKKARFGFRAGFFAGATVGAGALLAGLIALPESFFQ